MSVTELFRFATPLERFMLLIGTLGALAHGTIQPLFVVIFGNILDSVSKSTSFSDLNSKIQNLCLDFVYLSIYALIVSYFQLAMFNQVGQSQTNKIRHRYLQAILRQEMGFFDKHQGRTLTYRFSR